MTGALTRIAKKLKLPGYLLEFQTGIWAAAFVFLLAGLFLPLENRLAFELGIVLGAFSAVAGAFHMWAVLSSALSLGERGAVKKLVLHNLLRYLSFGVLLAVSAFFRPVDPVGVFLGIFCLKLGAYAQPVIHKAAVRLAGL